MRKELADTEFATHVNIALLATGFVHILHKGLVTNLGLQLDNQGNVLVNNFQTSRTCVFPQTTTEQPFLADKL